MIDTKRSRPGGDPEATQAFGGAEQHSTATPDIANLSPREWDAFLSGYDCGLSHGRALGYRAAEDDIAAVWAPVAAMVHRAASQPPKSPETVAAERRRAESSRAYWAERRGEVPA